jgi:hypothetical protein
MYTPTPPYVRGQLYSTVQYRAVQYSRVYNTPVEPLGLHGESAIRIIIVTKIGHANGARVVLDSKLYLLETMLCWQERNKYYLILISVGVGIAQ